MWLGQMTLDPISGSIVAAELNRLEHDLFEADCAQAKERLGRTARIDELARTSGQRRADALVEMATRSRTAPADGHPPRPAVLLSSSATRRCTAASVSSRTAPCSHPSALDPWMDSAYFERALFTLGNRVDVSVRSRFFTGGTRRAIELRDRICTHPLLLRARRELPGRPHSRPTPQAARPPRRTGACSAASTTACATSKSTRATSASGHRRAQPDGAAASSAESAPGSTPVDAWPAP